jgi:hypothetical protein
MVSIQRPVGDSALGGKDLEAMRSTNVAARWIGAKATKTRLFVILHGSPLGLEPSFIYRDMFVCCDRALNTSVPEMIGEG